MAMFEWNPNFSVQIGSFDLQHKQLFETAEELYQAMSTGRGKDVIGGVLDKLLKYTQVHFAAEERAMNRFLYPEFEEHKHEHELLLQQVNDFRDRFVAGNTMLSLEVMKFLKDWLTHHINNTDKRYGPFLIKQGAV